MIKLSTGLADAMMGTSGALGALDGNVVLNLYSGVEPASADSDATGATLLVTIAASGGELHFEGPDTGVLNKDTGEVWMGTVATSGSPTFYRLQEAGDSNDASNTAIRVQGTVGPAGDLKLGTPNLIAGNPQTIDYYQLRLPLSYGG
jgi:hypothetical protein